MLAEWKSANSYSTRISPLKGNLSGGLNETYTLNSGSTVHDDGSTTSLTGGTGNDWFFTTASAKINDLQSGEQVN
jgi:hypothetical protein